MMRALLLAALLATPVQGQDRRLSPGEVRTAVAAVRAQLERRYAFPDRRPALAAALDRGLASERYRVADPRVLAERVSQDLRIAVRDRHLLLAWNPDEYRRLSAPAGSGSAGDREALYAVQARLANHGVADMRLLEGNVRYLRITDFWGVPGRTDAALENAMRFRADGDGLILDLRGGGGGSPAAVRYLVSHLLPADTPLMLHGDGIAADERTLASVPAGRMTGRPLYLLTDGACGSACEELAYHVRHYRLGRTVGATTEGAANNNDIVAVAPGFAFSLSVHSPRHALTGTNWEGVGIAPDLPVDPRRALELAHARILADIPAATPADRRRLDWARAGAEARLTPYRPSEAELGAIAGRYGDRTLVRDGERLVYRRPSRADMDLTPLGPRWFALGQGGYARLRAAPGTPAPSIRVEYDDGTGSNFTRR